MLGMKWWQIMKLMPNNGNKTKGQSIVLIFLYFRKQFGELGGGCSGRRWDTWEKQLRLGVAAHRVYLFVLCEGQETKDVNTRESPMIAISQKEEEISGSF